MNYLKEISKTFKKRGAVATNVADLHIYIYIPHSCIHLKARFNNSKGSKNQQLGTIF